MYILAGLSLGILYTFKGKLKENGTEEFNGKYTGYQAKNVWRGKCNNCPYLPLCIGAVDSTLF